MSTPDRKNVAVAFVHKDNTFLIARRRADQSFPLLWELPGGKCDAGESPLTCVLREVLEETGLKVEIEDGPLVVEHDYKHFTAAIHVFRCRIVGGEAKPLESDSIAWIRWDELAKYEFPEANSKVFVQAGISWADSLGASRIS